MAKAKAQPMGMANMVDLAIQPKETVYKKVIEDMGGGITRTTFVAVKDDE